MGSPLVHAFHSYHSYFLPHSRFPCFRFYLLCFLCFLSFTSLFFVFSLVRCCYLLCTAIAFYTACRDKIYHFYSSTNFGLLWRVETAHWFAGYPAITTTLCWLHHTSFPNKSNFFFVFLLPMALLPR